MFEQVIPEDKAGVLPGLRMVKGVGEIPANPESAPDEFWPHRHYGTTYRFVCIAALRFS